MAASAHTQSALSARRSPKHHLKFGRLVVDLLVQIGSFDPRPPGQLASHPKFIPQDIPRLPTMERNLLLLLNEQAAHYCRNYPNA
jgi:hypothetical protein